jgi:carbon-monoxide dehydrogenase medium subunit
MVLPEFRFHQPLTIRNALELLGQNSNATAMAGGTDLLVEMKKGLRQHSDVISLLNILELKEIREDNKSLSIGACSIHSDVLRSPLVIEFAPALAEATAKIGSEQIRNTGTIGGNICTAASCCDTAPALLAMHASVEIADKESTRSVPLKDFFIFNKKTILQPGELVTRILIPKPKARTGACYEKFGLREAGSIAVVSVAASLTIKKNILTEVSIVIGAVAPTPKISDQAIKALIGKRVEDFGMDSPLLNEAGDAAVRDSIPIDDIRGGAQFRRDVLKVLTQRAVRRAIEKVKIKGGVGGGYRNQA